MDSILGALTEQLGDEVLGSLAGTIGADQSVTQKALNAALPALIGAMANNAQKPSGAEALFGALDKHDGSILDGLSQKLGGVDAGDGSKILGHVLGNKQEAISTEVAKSSGLDMSAVLKLLPILAPIVLGMLGNQKRQQGFDAGGLADILAGERRQAEQKSPGLGGLGALIDADGDGSIMPEATKIGVGLLGKLFGKK